MAGSRPFPVILQVIPELATGGAEKTVVEMAEAIQLAGGVALVASEGGRLEEALAAAGGRLLRFPARTKNPMRIMANAVRLVRLIETHGVDLVHARSRAPAWSALIASRRTGRPLVTTYHGVYNQKGRIKGWYNCVMARGDRVIANSRYTAGIIRSRHGVADDRLRVIHRGVDPRDFDPAAVGAERVGALRAQWGVAPDDRIVLQAARLTRWKGQEVVIDAAALIDAAPAGQRAVFILAGDPQGRAEYQAALQARIAARGLTKRVRLVGHCPDIAAAFKAAHVAVVASIEPEAFGRASIEAQAMGCPVIVTDLGALPETVRTAHGAVPGTGWLVPPGDAAALARRLEQVLDMGKDALAPMRARARAHAVAAFSTAALQHKTLAIYDELLHSSLKQRFEEALRDLALKHCTEAASPS